MQVGSPDRHACDVPSQTVVTVLRSLPNCLFLVHLLLLVKLWLFKNANEQVLVPKIHLEICASRRCCDVENRRRHRITMLRMTSCSSRKHARDSDRCGCQSVELARGGEGISYIISPLQGDKIVWAPLRSAVNQDTFTAHWLLVFMATSQA